MPSGVIPLHLARVLLPLQQPFKNFLPIFRTYRTQPTLAAILHPKNCLPVVENGLLFAQRAHSARYAPIGSESVRALKINPSLCVSSPPAWAQPFTARGKDFMHQARASFPVSVQPDEFRMRAARSLEHQVFMENFTSILVF